MNRTSLGAALLALATLACSSSEPRTAPALPTGGSSGGPETITGVDWHLVAFDTAAEGTISVPPTETYTAVFGEQQDLHAQADCNVCNGGYETTGSALSVGVLACTRAYCGDDSLHDRYLQALGGTLSYERDGSELRIEYEEGMMRFEAQ
jgi:heat shock protein HslJ